MTYKKSQFQAEEISVVDQITEIDIRNQLDFLKKELIDINAGKEIWQDKSYRLVQLSKQIKNIEETLQERENYSTVEISERFTV
jgi:hypothetical protein